MPDPLAAESSFRVVEYVPSLPFERGTPCMLIACYAAVTEATTTAGEGMHALPSCLTDRLMCLAEGQGTTRWGGLTYAGGTGGPRSSWTYTLSLYLYLGCVGTVLGKLLIFRVPDGHFIFPFNFCRCCWRRVARCGRCWLLLRRAGCWLLCVWAAFKVLSCNFAWQIQVSFILLAVSVLGVAHLVHSRALVVVSERIVQLELETVPFALAVGWQAVWLDGWLARWSRSFQRSSEANFVMA